MMKRMGGVLEGLILLAIGLYAGWLVLGDDYWRFLNPKFKWLTGLTAAMFLVTGSVAIWNPNGRARLSRSLIFLVFVSFLGIELYAREPRDAQSKASPRPGSAVQEPPRVTVGGIEYIRINTAELFVQCEKKEPGLQGERFVTMGIVHRNEDLDRAGQFVVVRIVVTCCLADAVGVGLRVRSRGWEDLQDGQWVEVYGTLEPLDDPSPEARLKVEGMRLTAVSRFCEFVPTRIEAVSEPDVPFIFEIRDGEPYAY
ncbi:MAG: hypothetical protein MUC41_06590 [Syntrophobacteraceae bacterium]|jgi:uncharacterized repeat protein (TIGR03943 family)|nr:hypothetical protein [Syntrophobacteraceae bacterium]